MIILDTVLSVIVVILFLLVTLTTMAMIALVLIHDAKAAWGADEMSEAETTAPCEAVPAEKGLRRVQDPADPDAIWEDITI